MSDPVRIAVIEESADIGGAEVNLLSLCRLLDRERFRFLVVVPAEGPLTERLAALGVDYRVLPRASLLSTSFFLRGRKVFNPLAVLCDLLILGPQVLSLRRLLRRERVNVVHTNSMLAHLYGALAARLAGVPCLWHMQDIVDAKCLGLVRRALAIVGGGLPARIVAVSGAVAAMFTGRAAGRVRVVYNGSDTARFAPGPADSGLRLELGLGGEDLVVGIVGRLVRWKGHPEFLRAAALVAQQVSNVRFLVVGDTTFGPGSFGEELRTLARDLGLAERVIFTGARDDVPDLMRLMNVFVHASVTPEPFGLVVTEAMASGLPVVASCCGGPAEIIENRMDGLLVDPRDNKALSEAILLLLADGDLRRGLGANARRKVEGRFSLQTFAAGMAGIYAELAN